MGEDLGKGEASGGTRTGIETLTQLLEDAFQGDSDQSLLASLRDLRDEDWTALPAGAGRSIAEILEHVGWHKWMDEDRVTPRLPASRRHFARPGWRPEGRGVESSEA